MGVEPALARGAVRASFGWSTSEAEIGALLTAWNKVISSLLNKHANAA
jgi:cysteine desulfurase